MPTEYSGRITQRLDACLERISGERPSASDWGLDLRAKRITDAAMTSGSAVLTSATAAFTVEDENKTILVVGSYGGGTLLCYIDTYTSATEVTLSVAATTTVSNAEAVYGPDATTALQTAIDQISAGNGAKNLLIPRGAYIISSTIEFGKTTDTFTNARQAFRVEGDGPSERAAGTCLYWAGADNGTMVSVMAISWAKIAGLQLDGVNRAGKGLHVKTRNTIKSCQNNEFSRWDIRNCVYGLYVSYETDGDDDVSQNKFAQFTIVDCEKGVYQEGAQIVYNTYEFFSVYNSTDYAATFVSGDMILRDWRVISGTPNAGPSANYDIVIGAAVKYMHCQDLIHECHTDRLGTSFSSYLFEAGDRPWVTNFDRCRIYWTIPGGRVIDYQQRGPVNLRGVTVSGDPATSWGTLYFSDDGLGERVIVKMDNCNLPSYGFGVELDGPAILNSNGLEVIKEGVQTATGAMTSGSGVVTATASVFAATDVGKLLRVPGAGGSGAPLKARISGYTSATQVTLDVAASTSASGQAIEWYTEQSRNATRRTVSPEDEVSMGVDSPHPRMFWRHAGKARASRVWEARCLDAGDGTYPDATALLFYANQDDNTTTDDEADARKIFAMRRNGATPLDVRSYVPMYAPSLSQASLGQTLYLTGAADFTPSEIGTLLGASRDGHHYTAFAGNLGGMPAYPYGSIIGFSYQYNSYQYSFQIYRPQASLGSGLAELYFRTATSSSAWTGWKLINDAIRLQGRDVATDSPADGDSLVYQSSSTKWKPLAVLPAQSGNAGKLLKTDGSATSWWAPTGTGFVKASSNSFDGATAKVRLDNSADVGSTLTQGNIAVIGTDGVLDAKSNADIAAQLESSMASELLSDASFLAALISSIQSDLLAYVVANATITVDAIADHTHSISEPGNTDNGGGHTHTATLS